MDDDEGKFKEPIWSINPNWRGLFYGVLSFLGVAVSAFTLYEKWGNGWLEIFNEIRNGIVSSVVVVWFVFQAVDWVTPRAISFFNYIKKIMAWGDPYREAQIKRMLKEEQEKRERFAKEVVKLLEKNNAPQEDIQQVQYISDSLKPPNYP